MNHREALILLSFRFSLLNKNTLLFSLLHTQPLPSQTCGCTCARCEVRLGDARAWIPECVSNCLVGGGACCLYNNNRRVGCLISWKSKCACLCILIFTPVFVFCGKIRNVHFLLLIFVASVYKSLLCVPLICVNYRKLSSLDSHETVQDLPGLATAPRRLSGLLNWNRACSVWILTAGSREKVPLCRPTSILPPPLPLTVHLTARRLEKVAPGPRLPPLLGCRRHRC